MKSLLSGDLSNMTIEELVSLYEKLCLAQDRAEDYFESAHVYRIVHRQYQLLDEMRHRAVDERPALFRLYSHPHPRVRVNAARSTYALNPQPARAVLEQLETPHYPWGVDAKMSLDRLREGSSLLPSDPDYWENVKARL